VQILLNLGAVAYLILFLFAGARYARLLLPRESASVRLAMGATLALFAQMWLPALFSFFLGFAPLSQMLALALFAAPAFFLKKKPAPAPFEGSAAGLRRLLVLPSLLLCGVLLYTHVLLPEDGALYTGQSCFGDMSMHLSFIASIARSGAFPPLYSIQAGDPMGYPFLCDSISSTYLVLGASLRLAYILPMIPALYAVFSWYFLLMERFLKSPKRAALAYALFFLGGGLGLMYFLDGARADPSQFTRMFTAFYETPTNNVEANVLWVNPIADLLIPQRATLFGWSVLLPCLYLLYRMAFEGEWRYGALLGVLAGGLPLMHTHSFLALGIVSAGALVRQLFLDVRQARRFLPYALLALCLSLPQLMRFTFAQADNAGFLRLSFNWVNKEDPYLWFYVKNIGLPFVLLPFAFLTEKRLRPFFLCALPIWVLCEFVVFQPNDYDNNKLLFVVHMLSCGLAASFLGTMYHKLRGLPGRALMGAAVVFVGVISGILTLARETVSRYELFSRPQVEAAQYAKDHLPKDAVLLTADEHNNPFAALAGLTIVQGSPSYLYFHGVYDTARAQDVTAMYTEPGALQALAPKYGVTHAVLSSHEYAMGADAAVFEGLPVVYENGEVIIYSLN
jgi:hypothetical protein